MIKFSYLYYNTRNIKHKSEPAARFYVLYITDYGLAGVSEGVVDVSGVTGAESIDGVGAGSAGVTGLPVTIP